MKQQLPPNTEQINDRQLLAIQRTSRIGDIVLNGFGPPPRIVGPFKCVAATNVIIDHGLARIPISWQVVDVTGGFPNFIRVSWDDKTLVLSPGTNCTATFRVQ